MAFPSFQTRDRTRGLVGLNTSAKNERLLALQYGAGFLGGNKLHEWFALNSNKEGAVLTNQGFWVGQLFGPSGGAYCALVPSMNNGGGLQIRVSNGGTASLTCLDGYGAVVASASTSAVFHSNNWTVASGGMYRWSSTTNSGQTADLAVSRNAAGVLEVNNGTAGTLRDLKLRNLIGTGNLATGTVAKSANYTATTSDGTIEVDASGAARTITLFASSGNAGKIIVVKKTDSSANAVTIDGNASETIDGATTISLASQYSTAILQVNTAGTGWNKLAGV